VSHKQIGLIGHNKDNDKYIRLFVTKTEYSKDPNKQTDRQTDKQTLQLTRQHLSNARNIKKEKSRSTCPKMLIHNKR